MSVPDLFDRRARALRRERYRDRCAFLERLLADEWLDHFAAVDRRFDRALVVGAVAPVVDALRPRVGEMLVLDPSGRRAAAFGGVAGEEDAAAFPPGSFDLIAAIGTLDTVADLPGALALFRRALLPDGLFLATLFGAPSLPTLRPRVGEMLVLDPSGRRATAFGGVAGEEDGAAFPPGSFDLIAAIGTLDTVADLPGALALFRRALLPDGLFLATLFGAPSLPTLRAALTEAQDDRFVQRHHPQVDARAGGDLLTRAGFALPVADLTTQAVSYRDLDGLVRDLREAGATNVLTERRGMTRAERRRLHSAFAARAVASRTDDSVSLLTLTGWAPADSQPQPARRGSGTSLAALLDRSG